MMNELTTSEFEFIVKRIVAAAKEAADEKDGSAFEDGRRLGYYEVLDIVKNELTVREIDLEQFGLDFDLDSIV